jgi:hypothetical protein
VPAVPTALEAHERVGGPAATRQSVLVRAVIASYTQPTQIEIPILPALVVKSARMRVQVEDEGIALSVRDQSRQQGKAGTGDEALD